MVIAINFWIDFCSVNDTVQKLVCSLIDIVEAILMGLLTAQKKFPQCHQISQLKLIDLKSLTCLSETYVRLFDEKTKGWKSFVSNS
jgi:hypothetical protein